MRWGVGEVRIGRRHRVVIRVRLAGYGEVGDVGWRK